MARDLFEEAGITQDGGRDLFAEAGIEVEEESGRTVGNVLKDAGVTGLKGLMGLQQSIVGLADLTTGGNVGRALDSVGISGDESQKGLSGLYSAPQQEANRKLEEAKGFTGKLTTALENPSTILTTVGESIPQMIGGAGVARGLLSASKTLAPWAAGAVGEGVMGMGSAAEGIREESAGRGLTGKQSLDALGSGAGTALFGALGGKITSKLGWGDIDTILARGGPEAIAAGAAKQGFLKQVIGSGISEGVFEELPQSMQETMWQNHALGKPIMEGVPESAAMGLLAGGFMGGAGGGYNAIAGKTVPAAPVPAVNLDPIIQDVAGIANMPSVVDSIDGADLLDEINASQPQQYGAVVEAPRAIVETPPARAIVETAQGAPNGTASPAPAEVVAQGGESGGNLPAESLPDAVLSGSGLGLDTAAGDVAPGSGTNLAAGTAERGGAVAQASPAHLFGMSGAQIEAMQGGKMKGANQFPGVTPTEQEIQSNKQAVENARAAEASAVDLAAGEDPRIASLKDAGLPAGQVLQAAKELKGGDDSLVKDLARIGNIKLPAAPAATATPPATGAATHVIARVGATPNSTEPVTVKAGVVHLGDYPAQNFETGDDITVPEGASFEQVADALRNGGALSTKQRIYAGEKGMRQAKAPQPPLPEPGAPELTPTQQPVAATEPDNKPPAKARPRKILPPAKTSDEFAERARKEFVKIIKDMGGIGTVEAKDITGEPAHIANRMAPGLFRIGGNALDLVARRLHEAGYISDADYNDVDGGVQAVRELVNQALGKEAVMTGADQERYNDMLRQEQRLAEQEEELSADMPAADETLATMFAEDDADLPGFAAGETDTAAQMRALGFTEEEINAELKAEQDAEAAGGTATGAAREGDRVGEGQEATGAGAREDGGFDLAGQTPAEVAAAEKRTKQAAADKADADAKAEARAKADRARDDFSLTGSDRASDANAGQADIFSTPTKLDTAAGTDPTIKEAAKQSAIIPESAIKAGTRISDPETAASPKPKTVSAKKAMQAANQNVSKYESLLRCMG